MAVLASNILPSDAYKTLKRNAVQLKINLQGFNTFMSVNDADYDYLRGIHRTLTRSKNQINTLKVIPGVDDFAKVEEKEPLYEAVNEYSALVAVIDDAIAWMNITIPTNVTVKDPSTWDDSTMISNTFTPVQTAGLRTELTTVIAEII